MSCPPATQNLELNTKNRDYAFKTEWIKYGPLNVDEPGDYWKDNAEYFGTTVAESQKVELPQAFRGYKTWHRYSDKQIEATRKWILFIAERDNIDVRDGLQKWIKAEGVKAFDWKEDAYYGRVKGLLTHTNTRKDKTDLFPQPELMDMILSL